MEWDRAGHFRDQPSKCDPLRKEVIQPQVLLRLPCYDLVPVTKLAFDATLLVGWDRGFGHSRLPWLDGRCVQGSGTYSPRRC